MLCFSFQSKITQMMLVHEQVQAGPQGALYKTSQFIDRENILEGKEESINQLHCSRTIFSTWISPDLC